ncbi:extracellular solute-binding protein [Paenibacillus sp. LMG 31461]|uniref:Extracellular solute-binding protein n=1 Tax=Paenibacillus plantarum TaxID=2654975 RepID=A0ABX1XD78_9BACL|nr:extracellular solute-binding protein [Paenibacillus plantarum]NOU66427.1 extracellular solute-binding protein [Paenibacillus plantarum]
MKKKISTVLLASFMLLTACSSNSSDTSSTTTPSGGAASTSKEITVWAWDKNFNIAAMNLAKDAYSKDHPDVKINVVEYAQDDIIQKMNTGLNSGSKSGLPNVVLIEDYRAQSFLKTYPDAFADMSASIKASDFAEYKLGPTSLNGKQYGVPFDSGVTGLYVRRDYLEQAGYKVDDLKNIDWQKFIEVGKAVKAKTGKDLLTQDPNDLGLVRMMIQSAGAWYLKSDGTTPDLKDNAVLKEAFETYKEIMNANIVKINSDWNSFLAGFNSGAVASVPTGNWITPSIKSQADQSGKWAVVPFPKLKNTASSVNASNLGGSSWYVLNSTGKDTAADFLGKTLGSDVNLYQKLVTDVGVVGTYKPAAQGEAYTKADDFFGGQKVISDFATWTAQIPKVNYGLHTYAIEDILKVEMQNFLKGKDIAKVFSDAQSQAESQLK